MQNENVTANSQAPRLVAVMACALSVVTCLAYAWFRDELPDWWRGYGGGIPYVVFWITFWFVLFPIRRCVIPICVFAVGFTCVLEVLQLWKPDWLMRIRETRIGAALLGSGFDWNDFPPYLIGGIIGYAVLIGLTNLSRRKSERNS